MTSQLRFTITFHGPFQVLTGGAREGFDATVDPEHLLPATSLKGLMRASATRLLRAGALVEEVFGTPRQPCPWAWSDAVFAAPPVVRPRTRIRVDPVSGAAASGALLVGEEVWATQAEFEVALVGGLPPERRDRHALVLRAAARSLTSLGASRRRGQGWVTVTDDGPPSAEIASRLLGLEAVRA